MTAPELALFVAAGMVGRRVNSISDDAKLFVFPLPLASGPPPVLANAIGAVALWPAQIPAICINRHVLAGQGMTLLHPMWLLALIGAVVGAGLLIVSSERVFLAAVPFVLTTATCSTALGNCTAIQAARILPSRRRTEIAGLLINRRAHAGWGHFDPFRDCRKESSPNCCQYRSSHTLFLSGLVHLLPRASCCWEAN